MSNQLRIRADFSTPATVRFEHTSWVESPSPGVERKMLDRVGAELARATSIVRYSPDSSFAEHTHDGGEEIVVLDGVFSDQTGDFPAGTYLRNPPGSRHAPRSATGCTIFVKLRQFMPGDDRQRACRGSDLAWTQVDDGIRGARLHRFGSVDISLVDFDAGASWTLSTEGGLELLVYSGALNTAHGPLTRWDWQRLPHGDSTTLRAQHDTRIYLKRGHLTCA